MDKKSNLNFKIVAFWFAMISITVIFLTVFISNLVKVRVFDSISDIDRAGLLLEGDEITQQDGTYYVYIYSEESELNIAKRQELEPAILNYFTYVSLNESEELSAIYGYCVDDFALGYLYGSVYKYLGTLHSDIKASNVPLLVKISNGSVSTVYTSLNKIESELQSAMK